MTGRPVDRLALQEQDPVAAYLGLLDADALLVGSAMPADPLRTRRT